MKRIILTILLLVFSTLAEAKDMMTQKQEVAVFAGGCFWCMQKPFDQVKGVISTEAGYTGGTVVNPTYEQVSAGHTGHKESLRVTFDPAQVYYQTLLQVFWHNVDPFDAEGQFCDKGNQYSSAIFYQNDEQKRLAEISKQEVATKFGKDVVTEIAAGMPFYPAEDYHQSYYLKNLRYTLTQR